MLIRKTVSIFAVSLSVSLFGQENLAFSNDRFSGISSAFSSPTQPFLNPNPWDLNIISANISVNNDYAYISERSFLSLVNSEVFARDEKNNITGENTPGILDFFNKNVSSAYVSEEVMGPSFSFRSNIKGKTFQFGLFTRQRMQASAIDVDNYLKFQNQSLPDPENFNFKPFQTNAMNWGEIGFNVATEIFPYASQQWILGGNIKYEIGFDAAGINSLNTVKLSASNADFDGEQTETVVMSDFNIVANYATNYNFETENYDLQKRGQGLGLDLGISMVDKDSKSDDYNLKLSLSLLDFGSVKFNGESHLFKGDNFVIVNNPNLNDVEFDNPEQYLKLLSSEVYGDENASLQRTSFTVGLPTNLHFNISKNVRENHYVNLDFIQRTPVFDNSLRRSNIVNVSYTIQKPFIGYGGSVSLYEYQKLQLGAYLRIGPLVLGSSNFLPLVFKQKKLNGGDFFIALKLYPFWDNEFKRHRRADCNCD